YVAKHGSTNSRWLTALYQGLLGRAPDSQGLNGWLSQLSAGSSRFLVAQGINTSVERETRILNQDYLGFLQRSPDAAGLSYWLGQFQFPQNATRTDVAVGIVGSDEFFERQGSDNTNFIIATYRDVLNRTRSQDEINSSI